MEAMIINQSAIVQLPPIKGRSIAKDIINWKRCIHLVCHQNRWKVAGITQILVTKKNCWVSCTNQGLWNLPFLIFLGAQDSVIRDWFRELCIELWTPSGKQYFAQSTFACPQEGVLSQFQWCWIQWGTICTKYSCLSTCSKGDTFTVMDKLPQEEWWEEEQIDVWMHLWTMALALALIGRASLK